MQLQDNPDPDCNVSPAMMIVLGRPIRDAFAFINLHSPVVKFEHLKVSDTDKISTRAMLVPTTRPD